MNHNKRIIAQQDNTMNLNTEQLEPKTTERTPSKAEELLAQLLRERIHLEHIIRMLTEGLNNWEGVQAADPSPDTEGTKTEGIASAISSEMAFISNHLCYLEDLASKYREII